MRPDRRVVALARGEEGMVTAAQLAAAGLSPTAIAHRVATGWLVRKHRGVYLVGPLEAPLSRLKAAVLAVGDGALLGHFAAAAVWELRAPVAGAVDVTLPGRNARSRPGIRVHRVDRLHPADAVRHRGLPVTSPARTLLDLATLLAPRDLARVVEESEVRQHVTTRSLNEQFERYPAHRGRAALAEAIGSDPALTRSEAERRLLELIRGARLPAPETNVRLAGHEVDVLWRRQRLVVEVDGFAFHSTRAAFERDRLRDANLTAARHRVIRITWRRLVREPEAVIAILAAALAGQASPQLAESRS
jgi:very-short-patch-repair endonuclease